VEREALLRELVHRTRNNMQLVIGLLNRQADESGDPALTGALAKVKRRIHSMALAEDKLRDAEDYSSLDFDEYVRDLVTDLLREHGVSPDRVAVNLSAEGIRVPIDVATPCGLILTELISNAIMHAFPEGRTGTITIRVRRLKNGEIELGVKDDGVGVRPGFDVGRESHLGLQLVVALGERQLGGRVTFDTTRGMACTVAFREPQYQYRAR